MAKRLRIIGVITLVIGLVFMSAGVYAYTKVQGGANALESFSHAQNVTLSYNENGELVDRGSTEGAAAIMSLLTDDWNWPVNEGDLDPDSPVVDTATEYMYQMATIAYHVLNGSQSVTLAEQVAWDGDRDGVVADEAPVYTTFSLPDGVWDPLVEGYGDATFAAGTYEVPVNGRYWTEFNRTHPLDGPARADAWTGTVFGLFAQLGVGATTHSSLELGLGVALVTGLTGVSFLILGGGLVWISTAGKPEEDLAAPAS